jgi:hypothetical protein
MKGISSGKVECDGGHNQNAQWANCVMIAVSECGSGILPELPERVFDGLFSHLGAVMALGHA